MTIALTCECARKFKVKDEHAGRRLKCPSCGNILAIPTLPGQIVRDSPEPIPRCQDIQSEPNTDVMPLIFGDGRHTRTEKSTKEYWLHGKAWYSQVGLIAT